MTVRDETEAASQFALDELLASGPFVDAPWQKYLRHGPAEQVVPELVNEYQIDLLVMGTVARSGFNGVLIGNTAERVLDEVRCSVLAVKPPEFVSPIHVSTQPQPARPEGVESSTPD
jgi:nucleotide-binding universal stress UspA family protein